MRSAIRAKELLGLVSSTELDAPILPREDPRWGRLRSGLDPGVNLRDRFRGALIGGAIGDAMGRANEGVWPREGEEVRLRISECGLRNLRIAWHASAGHDADTVAAMACTLSGAYHGYSRLPQRLLAELEFHDPLLELADNLHALHRRLYGAS